MARKKRRPDRHKVAKKTLRLPPPYGEWLDQMAQAEQRTQTVIVMRALRDYAEKNGHPMPQRKGNG